MAITLTKYTCFATDLGLKKHNLNTDTLKAALTNTAPSAGDTAWSLPTYPAPAAANGYTSGGDDIQNLFSAGKMTATDVVVTATAGGIGPFRYVIVYNDTSAGKELVGWYDYGSSITLAAGETLTEDFDPTAGVLTIT